MITIINFKTYKQGKEVLKLAKAIEKAVKRGGVIVGVQTPDIKEISEKTKLRVYAQHVDYFKPGRNTGFVLPETVKGNGAQGTFLNHSEHKLNFDILKKTLERCKNLGLHTAVFTSNVKEAKKIDKLNPNLIILEPPKLVAGKISVSEAKPELIKKIARNLKTKFLVGAGIHNKRDVKMAINLGAHGIAVSSAITKSKNPGKKLKELLGK